MKLIGFQNLTWMNLHDIMLTSTSALWVSHKLYCGSWSEYAHDEQDSRDYWNYIAWSRTQQWVPDSAFLLVRAFFGSVEMAILQVFFLGFTRPDCLALAQHQGHHRIKVETIIFVCTRCMYWIAYCNIRCVFWDQLKPWSYFLPWSDCFFILHVHIYG